ncbi:MAG: DNA-binding protein [Sphingobacteriales bacterium 17-39-43]|uniref:ORF6N domain-containing protein n=1 Tax=Daejeonella sp. TaxID=2805397 RepID=UPI000BC92781|nr:ORF6N domain-containing protein [Daejeonella sp.]OYZ33250.1 MAG: DNA-binding protein [Sphingobacteriales bacterium 16-39-50]OZA26659.1 MAG: DNA-binding protein [Sphingobacteriales bacterium 17-39-43]HQS06006.1 ORF6N domain-containing protein [Daejeonella sp.]HQT21823.1 ORF6N domain-containing protein [Daejeonella sp.]HQT56554.1 ORF6N domain-containing protein [Daejeonella sp.]
MKKEELLVPEEIVISKIYYIRKQKVMLDMDLAILYQVETRSLKQAVKRNILRFPDDFMFQLTKQEWQELITICDKLPQTAKYSPATPFVFSEQGVAMMSSILNSERAIHVNIQIIRIFTKLRLMLTDNTEIRLEVEKIKNKLDNQDKNMEIVFRYLDELLEKQERPLPPRKRIGFKPDEL